MTTLKWTMCGVSVVARSACCVDEDHFEYRFNEVNGSWMNDSDAEVKLTGSSPRYFDSLEDAQNWAEGMEQGWLAYAAVEG